MNPFMHSWQYSYKCSVLLWVGLLASGLYYFILERTSRKFWTYILMMAQKWPLLKLHICNLLGKNTQMLDFICSDELEQCHTPKQP